MKTLENLLTTTKKIALTEIRIPSDEKEAIGLTFKTLGVLGLFLGITTGIMATCSSAVDFIERDSSRPYFQAVKRYGDINQDGRINDFESSNFDYCFQAYMCGRFYRGHGYSYTYLPSGNRVDPKKLVSYLKDFGKVYSKNLK